jgi:3',5'-cyclic AMP phosphodiesterase CpdA
VTQVSGVSRATLDERGKATGDWSASTHRTQRAGVTLAIIGDTHYANPAYHRQALAGQSNSPNLEAGVRRHLRTTQAVLPVLLDEVRAAAPDVVIQLGDVVQGHGDYDEANTRELHIRLRF